ncbi:MULTISPECIES: hypothetical protein [Bradyrhizobium]|uniref:hypothetical protein n=1 Tax=Bradyrhizobium TaxID=374 RepID=UPI0004095E7B|nr:MULTISPECIES: hypothetical protein [Bradyrhizobium]WLB93197.1 hypothetical protein QIH91_22060 [Bradyrhizobium japonicum USDA 135]
MVDEGFQCHVALEPINLDAERLAEGLRHVTSNASAKAVQNRTIISFPPMPKLSLCSP